MSDFNRFFNEENDDDNDYEMQFMARNSVIYLIDTSVSMAAILPRVLKKLCELLYEKIQTNDKVAIILYGTEGGESKTQLAHIHGLLDLGLIDVLKIMQLEQLIKDKNAMSAAFTSGKVFSLRDAFQECQYILNKEKKYRKYVYLITNQDDPVGDNKIEKTLLSLKSKDLVNAYISLHVIGINSLSKPFKYDKFFANLLYFQYADDCEPILDPIDLESFDAQMDAVLQLHYYYTRLSFKGIFYLSDNIFLGLKGVSNTMEKKLPSYIKVDPRSNLPVVGKTVVISQSTGATLKVEDINYYFEFGGEKVIFTKKEMDQIKYSGEPCFRDRADIKDKHNVTNSVFLAPNEELVTGSCSLFAHLIEQMFKRNTIAVCKLVARKRASPRLVALLPQLASYDHIKQKPILEGFHMITLPFADDIRSIPAALPDLPNEEAINAAKRLIKNMTKDFVFPRNPVLQKHYNYLKAIASESTEVPEDVDETRPDFDEIFSKSGAIIEEFNNLTLSICGDKVEQNKKREHSDEDEKPARKARSSAITDLSEENCRVMVKEGRIDKCTVPQLTTILSNANAKIKSKKKGDLVKAVIDLYQ